MNVWNFIHILSAIVAFGVLFSQPMVARSVDGAGEAFARVGMYIQAPALVVLIASGIATMYSNDWDFGAPWVSVAFTVWILMAVVLALLVRAHRAGTNLVAPLTGCLHLLLVIALWAMIWKPGGMGG